MIFSWYFFENIFYVNPKQWTTSITISYLFSGPNHGKVVVCYIGTWAVYRPSGGSFAIEHVEPSLCTHLVYSFVGLNTTHDSIKPLGKISQKYSNKIIPHTIFRRLARPGWWLWQRWLRQDNETSKPIPTPKSHPSYWRMERRFHELFRISQRPEKARKIRRKRLGIHQEVQFRRPRPWLGIPRKTRRNTGR